MERLDVVIPVYRPDRRFFKLMRMVFSQDCPEKCRLC